MKREYPVWAVTERDSWSHIQNIECATGPYILLVVIVIA